MRGVLLWLLLVGSCFAQAQPVRPADQTKYFLSVWTSPNWQENATERTLVEWFNRDPQLSQLKSKTHWHHYPTDALMIQRYASVLSASDIPCVTLQRPDGGVVYKASGASIPSSPSALYAAMKTAYTIDPGPAEAIEIRSEQDCPDGQCDPSYAMPWKPDSAVPDGNLFGVARQPVRNTAAAIVWVLGGVFILFIFVMLSLLALGVVYLLSKWK